MRAGSSQYRNGTDGEAGNGTDGEAGDSMLVTRRATACW